MSDDIVERLRQAVVLARNGFVGPDLLDALMDAAVEIERLRARIAALEAATEAKGVRRIWEQLVTEGDQSTAAPSPPAKPKS